MCASIRLAAGMRRGLLLVSLLALSLPALSYAQPLAQAAKPKVSAPFVVASGPGSQYSPSIAGNIVVYDNCPDGWGNCKVTVYDLATKQSYSVGMSLFYGNAKTDGKRVVWKDSRNKTSAQPFDTLNNIDIYTADLGDFASAPVTTAPNMQDEPNIAGNIVVWTDYRRLKKGGSPDVADIYMFDLSTGKETLVSTGVPGQGQQRHPVTNGKVIAWERQGDIIGYDIAARRQFPISTQKDAQVNPAVSGNTIVWEDYRNTGQNLTASDIYGYNLDTKQEFVVTRAHGAQTNPAIYGNIVVWEDDRNQPQNQALGPRKVDLYAYDLNSKQEFPLVVGGPGSHTNPSISGTTVVWEEDPSGGLRAGGHYIMGATISGITNAAPPVNPTPSVGSRAFPQTGKTVSGIFLEYWLKNGGLAQQGYPISSVMTEVSDLDGKPYQMQYFERAVFEAHPENQPPYNVLLSQLGTFQLRKKYPERIDSGKITPGAISGHLQYPSEGVPAMYIYAIPTAGQAYYVTRTWGNQVDYTLDGVEPGTYYVMATLDDRLQNGLVFVYTKAAQCGLGPQCNDHTYLPVTVRTGATTANVDPIDYGFQGSDQIKLPAPEGRCTVFKQTGRTLCGKFLSYWLTHGDLAQQGYPISNTLDEVSDLNGQQYVVQYFERAVFEDHPENSPPYDVLLSQLGTFRYKEKYGGK